MTSTASTPIEWLLDTTVAPGKLDDLRALITEMVQVTQANEPGALRYQFWLSADGTACEVRECYADDQAVLTHLATFGSRFASRFFAALTVRRAVVYGTPSETVQRAIAGMHPEYLTLGGGFTR